MITTFIIVVLVAGGAYAFLQHPKFGQLATGERLARIEKSANFSNGSFHNLSLTPQMTGDSGFLSVLKDFLTAENKRPPSEIPSVKTDLLDLPPDQNLLVWFGHSSYFMQIDGKTFLVDPVFSGNASPLFFMMKAFKGTDVYTPDDFPEIDYLFITHDHWDHLDYKTVKALRPKVKQVVTGLGTGAHLEYWGFDPSIIYESDWGDEVTFDDGFAVHTTSARHFAGRGLKPNKSLWVSFVLQTPTLKIFIGGDGGYDKHFAEIGEKFGGFDLAILENGQYNTNWKYIHMMPAEVLLAAKDLNAKRLFPVHSSKFALANHTWDAPLKTISDLNETDNLALITPIIGEQVDLNETEHVFKKWWETVE